MDIDWQISAPVVLQMKRTVAADCAAAPVWDVGETIPNGDIDFQVLFTYDASVHLQDSPDPPTGYSLTYTPEGLDVSISSSGIISCTPANTFSQARNCVVTAFNGCGSTTSNTFDLLFNP